LNEAIKQLSTQKAPGPDHIPNELIKCLDIKQRLILLDCINELYRKNVTPERWSEIIIVPIFKKGDKTKPENYRPISLVNTSLKLLTILMSNRLSSWCKDNAVISDYQAAYKKGTGCQDHVFVLNSAIQYHLRGKRNKTFALFVDLSKAFDSINHDKLWDKLVSVGLSSKFVSIIKSMYSYAKAKIRTKFGESCNFPIEIGVLQGETLSPKLFTIFMEEIVKIMHESDIPALKIASADLHILLYADDIVLLASNAIYLQDKINLLSSFFKRNNLLVNLNKTKVVIFRYNKNKIVTPRLFWDDVEIETVEKYTYLGVTFYGNMKYSQIANDFTTKASAAESQLSNLFKRTQIKTLDSRLRLFESLVTSVLLYCSHIWGISEIEKLVVFQNKFLRRILCLPNKTPVWFLRLETSCISIEMTFIKQLLGYYKKIISLPKECLIVKCFNALKYNVNNSKMKINWYRDLKKCLEKWDCDNLLEVEVDALDVNEVSKKCIDINTSIRSMIEMSVSRDIVRMQSSSTMPEYQTIRTHVTRQKFLNYNYYFGAIRLIVQMRANMGQLTVGTCTLKLNILSNFYDKSINAECHCCNLNLTEDLLHVMFICPRYLLLRRKFLGDYDLPVNLNQFLQFFSNISEEKMKNVYNYVKYMTTSREHVLKLD